MLPYAALALTAAACSGPPGREDAGKPSAAVQSPSAPVAAPASPNAEAALTAARKGVSPEGGASPRGFAGAPAAAPVWSVDKAASRLSFQGMLDGQTVDGVFRRWDAQVAFDPRNLKGSRVLVTVETASALTGEPSHDLMLPGPDWLSVRRFPKATFVTRTITAMGNGRYQAVADLRIRGVLSRAIIAFTWSAFHDVGELQATTVLDRTVFGIGQGQWRAPAPLSPQVMVNLRLVAKKGH